MRIVVAGGRNKADFLIGSLLDKHHEVQVINDDPEYCAYLSRTHRIQVYCGNPCKEFVLEEAQIADADILIALKPNDADNLIVAQMAKKMFHVHKVVAIVSNPKKVSVFQKLGVNTAISATYMVAQQIEQASTIEHLVNSLMIEHDSIVMSEVCLRSDSVCLSKKIKEIALPENVIICAILRGTKMIVPNGESVLMKQDKLLLLSKPENQEQAIHAFTCGCGD